MGREHIVIGMAGLLLLVVCSSMFTSKRDVARWLMGLGCAGIIILACVSSRIESKTVVRSAKPLSFSARIAQKLLRDESVPYSEFQFVDIRFLPNEAVYRLGITTNEAGRLYCSNIVVRLADAPVKITNTALLEKIEK